MKQTIKRYAVSSLTTFIAVFALVFFTAIQQPDFIFSKQSIVALICAATVVAVRALAKVVVEGIVAVFGNKGVDNKY